MSSTKTELTFVNLVSPDQASSRKISRTVRSHAARVSSGSSSSTTARKTAVGRLTKGKEDQSCQQRPSGRRKRRKVLRWSLELAPDGAESPVSFLTTDGRDGSIEPIIPYPQASKIGHDNDPDPRNVVFDPPFPALRSNVKNIPPYLALVLENYLEHLALPIPEIDDGLEIPLLRTLWFPIVLHDPLIFQVIVLFSASHYVIHHGTTSNSQQDQIPQFAATLFILKHRALASLNKAISEQSPGFVSDHVIAAAAKMASYEAIFGSAKDYHAHMSGVEKMLEVRGNGDGTGLDTLGLDGFLARLLLFIDNNSAFLLSTRLRLDKFTFPRRPAFMQPNLQRFLGSIT